MSPSLDEEHRKDLLGKRGEWCLACRQELSRNYCRQCDEFFLEGHAADCPWIDQDHPGHRTY